MAAPKIKPADVERLVEVLHAAPDRWVDAAALALHLYGHNTESKRRRVRAIANAAGSGVVSYPGSPGYALWARCTVDELHACVASYTSQTDEMRRRRDLYRIRLHREHPARFRDNDPDLRPSTEQLSLAV